MKLDNNYLFRCFLVIATLCLVVTVIVIGKPVLAPLALSCILAFVMTPVVRYLETQGLPRVPAVMLTIAVVVTTAVGLSVALVAQLGQLAIEMPKYEREIETKVTKLREFASIVPDRVWTMAEQAAAFTGSMDTAASTDASGQSDADEINNAMHRNSQSNGVLMSDDGRVDKVMVYERPRKASQPWLQWVPSMLGPLVEPLATLTVVVVLSVFMMVGRDDLRNRVLAILGRTKLTRTTQLLGDSSHRLGRYLLGLLAVNLGFAVAFAVGLSIVGVPYAALWGCITFFFRFIPYIGSATSMLLPFAMAIVTAPGWFAPIAVLVWYGTLEFSTGNFLEPWLFGRSVGMNPLAIIVALMFWTWAWGMLGLLLATPLSLTLVTLGRHFPGFEWSNLLLSDAPPLPRHIAFFQRLLAKDKVEVQTILTNTYRKVGASFAMQRLLLDALSHADRELSRGAIEKDDFKQLEETANGLVERLITLTKAEVDEAREDTAPKAAEGTAEDEELIPKQAARRLRAMTFSLGDARGRSATQVLLASHPDIELIAERAAPTPAVSRECVDRQIDLIIISTTATVNRALIESACRTLRRSGYEGWIAVGWWRMRSLAEPTRRSLKDAGADYVTFRMRAMERMVRYAERTHAKNDKPAIAASDIDRDPVLAPV
jgi:predicted PurR-regulated permease PerM